MDPNLCEQRESSTAVTSVVYENIILSMAYVPELHSLAKQCKYFSFAFVFCIIDVIMCLA